MLENQDDAAHIKGRVYEALRYGRFDRAHRIFLEHRKILNQKGYWDTRGNYLHDRELKLGQMIHDGHYDDAVSLSEALRAQLLPDEREKHIVYWEMLCWHAVRAKLADIVPLLRLGKMEEAERFYAPIACLDSGGLYRNAVAEEAGRRRLEADRLARERAEAEERQRREDELRVRKQVIADRVFALLASDFLSADEHLQKDPEFGALSQEEYTGLKARFVREWAERELKLTLDLEQAAAVAATRGDVKVVARAGAGKTRTLVARALFLQKHCRIPPSALLLLAFNKAAARQMRDRLDSALHGDVPHVMTFHALAYALVNPEEKLLRNKRSTGDQSLSREIQGVIDAHLQSSQYRPVIRDLMLMHFREDWERVVRGGFTLAVEDLIAYRRALPRETLKGEYVKSFGERLIANTLFEHDIEYEYERNYRWNGVNYRPDFTIRLPDHRGVVIEYFGLSGDSDYDQMSQEKRLFWARQRDRGWTLVEFSPPDITARGAEGFAALLMDRLERLGVSGRRLTDGEIWERIHRRAIGKFTNAIESFVSRCRMRNYGCQDLLDVSSRHKPISEAERLFLEVVASIYSGYLNSLAEKHQEDFHGLVWRAIRQLNQGDSLFARDRGREEGDIRRLQFVLVDEFQDFSEMFYELLQGVRSLSPGAELFCVGDDWQAINGFAGSDLRFFQDFEKRFRDTSSLNISTNYRSPARVVQVSNALMAGRGTPAVPARQEPGCVRTANLGDFAPSPTEQARHSGDDATPAVLRVVKHLLSGAGNVVMLSRRHDVPWYVSYSPQLVRDFDDPLERFTEHIRSFLPKEDWNRVTASTAHEFKGLEAAAVIVLDGDEGSYPLIHPNWVFLRVFGDDLERLEAEERRLFYVALTRAQHSLVILSKHPTRESPYLVETRERLALDPIVWAELPPPPSVDGERLEVRVSNAYDVRGQLRERGYRFDGPGRYWHRSVMAEGFELQSLCREPWTQPGVCIEIYSEEGKLLRRRHISNADSASGPSL